jgi:hypothetical protein
VHLRNQRYLSFCCFPRGIVLTIAFSQALATRSCEASGDDEIGHPILYFPIPANKVTELYDRDEEIALTVIRRSRGSLEAGTLRAPTSIVKTSRTHGLFHARVSHQLQMAEVVRNSIPPSVWSMSRKDVYMDYVPFIRAIIAAEDLEEKAYMDMQKERPGRATRNSKGGYDRTFTVTTEVREALDETALRWQGGGGDAVSSESCT